VKAVRHAGVADYVVHTLCSTPARSNSPSPAAAFFLSLHTTGSCAIAIPTSTGRPSPGPRTHDEQRYGDGSLSLVKREEEEAGYDAVDTTRGYHRRLDTFRLGSRTGRFSRTPADHPRPATGGRTQHAVRGAGKLHRSRRSWAKIGYGGLQMGGRAHKNEPTSPGMIIADQRGRISTAKMAAGTRATPACRTRGRAGHAVAGV